MTILLVATIIVNPCVHGSSHRISTYNIQKKRQRSSLPFGGQYLFSSLPRWLFCTRTIVKNSYFFQIILVQFILGKTASAARNSVPKTAATTFAFSSVFILFLWVLLVTLMTPESLSLILSFSPVTYCRIVSDDVTLMTPVSLSLSLSPSRMAGRRLSRLTSRCTGNGSCACA